MTAAGLTHISSALSGTEVLTFVVRAGLGLVLGAAVGAERQWHQRRAGLRTNALVALGAALFELYAVTALSGTRDPANPTQVAAYIISGVGFLGAGVILRDGANVRGINTAATIWCSAAIGLLAGAGYLVEAVIAAAFVVAVHGLLRPLGRRIDRLPTTEETEVETAYRFEAVCRAKREAHVRALVVQALSGSDFSFRAVRSRDLEPDGDLVTVSADISLVGRNDVALEQAVSRLSLEPGVTSVSWTVVGEEMADG